MDSFNLTVSVFVKRNLLVWRLLVPMLSTVSIASGIMTKYVYFSGLIATNAKARDGGKFSSKRTIVNKLSCQQSYPAEQKAPVS